MERTHNQLVPDSTRYSNSKPPRPLSTEAMVPYQSEQNVNARFAPGWHRRKAG